MEHCFVKSTVWGDEGDVPQEESLHYLVGSMIYMNLTIITMYECVFIHTHTHTSDAYIVCMFFIQTRSAICMIMKQKACHK